ncbi:MAG: hypothetical protein AAF220_09835, partial [Pseudomonadota bacterium]
EQNHESFSRCGHSRFGLIVAVAMMLGACGVARTVPEDPDRAEIRVMLDQAQDEDARDNVEVASFLYDQAVERAQELSDPQSRTILTLRTQAKRLAWRDTRGLEADFAGQAAGIVDRALRLEEFGASCLTDNRSRALLYAAFFSDLRADLSASTEFPDYLDNDLENMSVECMSRARATGQSREDKNGLKSKPLL